MLSPRFTGTLPPTHPVSSASVPCLSMRHPFLRSATALPLAEVLEGREHCRRKGWRNQAIDYLPPFGNQVAGRKGSSGRPPAGRQAGAHEEDLRSEDKATSGTCSSFLPLTRGDQGTEDPIQEALQTQEAQCTAAQDQQGCAPSKEGV